MYNTYLDEKMMICMIPSMMPAMISSAMAVKVFTISSYKCFSSKIDN